MPEDPLALPKRLLRIRQQAARLAELRCLEAVARLERATRDERAARTSLEQAEQAVRGRARSVRLVEEVRASQQQIDRLAQELRQVLAAADAARSEYSAAVQHRRQADAEVDVLEKLLDRRRDELRRRLDQRKQQFADEWIMRRWMAPDAAREGSPPC